MTANNHRRSVQPGAPALIEHENLKFLIVNNPSPANLPQFIKVCVSVCYKSGGCHAPVCTTCVFKTTALWNANAIIFVFEYAPKFIADRLSLLLC